MAILIPSKNIYGEIQNPKVRDNVIERIDVVAVEVVDTKDNNANVYNNTFDIVTTSIENNASNFYWEAPTVIYNDFVVSTLAYVEYNNHTYTNIEIKIPLLQQNAWIKELNLGKDKDNNSNIQYNVGGYVHKGTVSSNNWSGTIQKAGSKAFISSLTKQSLSYNQTEQGDYSTYQIPRESTSSFIKYDVASGSANAKVNVVDGGNLITVKPDIITEKGIEYYKLSLKILVGCRIVKITSYNSVPESYNTFEFPISKENFNLGEATYEEYIPNEINLTVYGQTIGIDLVDTTVSTNSSPDKKVHSVEGNELMQTTNYKNKRECKIKIKNNFFGIYNFEVLEGDVGEGDILYRKGSDKKVTVDVGILGVIFIDDTQSFAVVGEVVDCEVKPNHLTNNFNRTIDKYKNGKETAVIRCSISDYMDYSTNEKVISIDGAKKCFELYDEVIPMIYGADGADKPMSLGNAGQAKAFTVIGRKIYYDGAVWQELTLQESETVYYISGTKTLQDLETVTLLSLNEEKLIEI